MFDGLVGAVQEKINVFRVTSFQLMYATNAYGFAYLFAGKCFQSCMFAKFTRVQVCMKTAVSTFCTQHCVADLPAA